MFASKDVFLKSTGGYTIARSVRLRSSATAYLSRTPASASNRTTWTWSGWVKRGTLGVSQAIFSGGTGANRTYLFFDSSNNLEFHGNGSILRVSTNVYRDPSAWYHIVWVLDTNNATAQNRTRIYINNVEITSWSTNVTISSGATFDINAVDLQTIGKNSESGGTSYFDGYLTEINFIDGQALTPSSFGAISTNGVWQPARYTGTYGTNGFYLNFSDNSAATAAAIGKDSSGNGNNWTPNGINLTTPASTNTNWDSMTDVPTLTSATAANYADWNPITQPYTNITRTTVDGNLNSTLASSGAGGAGTFSTIAMATGSWYAEFTVLQIAVGTNLDIGILRQDQLASIANGTFGAIGYSPYGYSCYQPSGAYANNNTSSTSGTSYTTNDIVQVAFNASTGKLWFGKNGTFMSSGDPAAGTNPAFSSIPSNSYVFAFGLAAGATGRTVQVIANFGQRPFAYTAPTGFVALNTYNLSTPTIANGAAYMAATLYTGTGATQSITNTVNSVSFQPDFVWVKGRSGATDHALYDVVRGTTKDLASNTTGAETTQATGLTAFGSTGFTVGALAKVNTNAATYVGWQWLANGTGVSNTNGSITSTVSVNATAGFSVVTYTGTGANATVGHGLGVAPSMIIVKARSFAGADWNVYHSSTGNTGRLFLDTTAAFQTVAVWNNTSPTSSVFTVGGAYSDVNSNTQTYVAYCFAPVAGYSAFGSYTGNGSTDGPFVYLGFRPRFFLVKASSGTSAATANWLILDTSRNTYNVTDNKLAPNLSDAENSASIGGAGLNSYDFLSNGVKAKSTNASSNESGTTYIYAAFAENPFKYSLAR